MVLDLSLFLHVGLASRDEVVGLQLQVLHVEHSRCVRLLQELLLVVECVQVVFALRAQRFRVVADGRLVSSVLTPGSPVIHVHIIHSCKLFLVKSRARSASHVVVRVISVELFTSAILIVMLQNCPVRGDAD